MGDGEGCPPPIDECVVAFFSRSHPLATANVDAYDDVRRDGSKPFDELGREPSFLYASRTVPR
jgi:hypothetical protein